MVSIGLTEMSILDVNALVMDSGSTSQNISERKFFVESGQPVDDNHLLLTGRADGIVHDGIWIVDLKNSSVKEVGNLVIPSATAPLVKITDGCFWLIAGEPDSNKNRTGRVSVISLKSKK